MNKKWSKETVFEESKKYSSRSEFKKNRGGAFKVAYENGWLFEMDWLKHPEPQPIKWTHEAVLEESKKYSSITEFNDKNASAYAVARKNGWLDEMTWLERKYAIRGFWQSKDNVLNESHKYDTLKDFRYGSPRAHEIARRNGWLDEMNWLKRTDRTPAGFWKIKENVIAESHKYVTRAEFCEGCYNAYISAKNNGWLEEMDWLPKSSHKEKGFWNKKENVLAAASKCNYKSEFRKKYPGAYASAWVHHWLDEMNFQAKESKGDPRGPIHIIYVYIDDVDRCAYVGATNDIKRRDSEHRREENDPVFKHFKAKGIEIPKCKVLLDGLTIVERQREERIQSLYYRDVLHYKLLNKPNLTGENIGSLGALASKWTKAKVIREAEKYKTPTEFFTKSAGAYDAALRYKMMNKETFPWFYSNRMPPRWWNDKGHVFEESRKYTTWEEFFWKSPAAHFSARKHKWAEEMTWLIRKQAPQKYWQDENNVINESKKYKTKTEFFKGCHAAYDYAQKHNLWEKMPWIKTTIKESGYWTKERVLEEGKKYSTKKDFLKNAPTAYSKANKYHWMDEMTWFQSDVKPQGYWQVKQNVMEESHKYNSRVDFRWGAPGAYRSSINNGWIEEMTWLKRPRNYNQKWTREMVFEVSKKFSTRGGFKKEYKSAYNVARINGWLDEMTWLTSIRKK